jgi:sensor histidine kinase YesM
MKMTMKFPKALYHIFFWAGIYMLWIILFHSYEVAITKTMTIQFCYLIFITADFYTIHNFIAPRFLARKKYYLFLLLIVLTVAISAWLRALIALQMNRLYFHDPGLSDFLSLYIRSFINIAIWVLIVSLGQMMLDRMKTEKRVENLEKERIRNELAYLKAQINPHTLFNSLNTVYGHIDKTNQTGRDILLQFSELLRYQLYECTEEKVSLEKEMAYLNRYISFERLRKDSSLKVSFKVENINFELQIAPLMLVVLIENAFKFVSHHADKENKICIDISTRQKVLQAIIWNTIECPHTIQKNKSGVGIANLKRRLELLYSNNYEFRISAGEDFYQTNLNIALS